MTHPPEAVEAVAKFASDHALLIASGCNMSVIILDATALLDQIAPLYREQGARVAEVESQSNNPYISGLAMRIAAAIRKGE